MQNKTMAYLSAYTPSGVIEYRTTNFEEVYRFKAICKEIDCPYAVRFRDEKPTEAHVVHRNGIVKTIKNFIHWFAFR